MVEDGDYERAKLILQLGGSPDLILQLLKLKT